MKKLISESKWNNRALEDRITEIFQFKKQRLKKEWKKDESGIRDPMESIKWTNIHIRNSQMEKWESDRKIVFVEILAEKSPSLMKNMNLQLQEAQWTLRYIVFKSLKARDKDRILKAAREKQLTHTRDPQ